MIRQTARLISFLFHPFFISILATFLLVFKNTQSLFAALEWTFFTGVFISAIFLFEYYGVKRGYFSNFDISRRKQRAPLYTFAIVTLLVVIFSLLILHGPNQLIIGATSLAVSLLILNIVNMKIKASVHVAGISAFILSMAIIYGGFSYIAMILIPIIAW